MQRPRTNSFDPRRLCAALEGFRVPAAGLARGRVRFAFWNASFLEAVELAEDEIVSTDVPSIFTFWPADPGARSRVRLLAAVIRNPSSARQPRTLVGTEHWAPRGQTSFLVVHELAATSPGFEQGKLGGAEEASRELQSRLAGALERHLERLNPMLRGVLASAPDGSPQRREVQKMVEVLANMQRFIANDFRALFLQGGLRSSDGPAAFSG